MSPKTRVARDSGGLLAGTLVNGLFAYVFFALATRTLGGVEAAPVAVLWTYWGVTVAVVTFPVQHWIIRTLHAEGEEAVGAAMPRMVLWVALISTASTALSWLAREQLFGSEGLVFPLMIGLVTAGSFFTGVVRGGLAGRGRYGATAVAIASDNIFRVIAGVVAVSAGGRAAALGWILVAGGLVGLAWPDAVRFRKQPSGQGEVSLRSLGAVAAGSLIGQVILIGGPAILAIRGGAPSEVTMLFTTLALFRAPYLLAVGVSNRITGTLTLWSSTDPRRVRTFRVVVVAATLLGAAVAAFGAYVFGPPIVGTIFGADTSPPRLIAAVVALGSVCAVGNLALSLVAIARGQGGMLTRAWSIAAVVVAVILLAAPLPPLAAVSYAFVGGQGTAFLVLLWTGRAAETPAAAAPAATSPPGGAVT